MRLSLLLLALGCQLSAQSWLSPAKTAEIEKLITIEMAGQRIPGMSIAIGDGSGQIWLNGYGMADLENFVPAKGASVYRTASIAKPITAVAAMQLVERGKLDLDAPIQTYLTSFPVKQWPFTMRHLLGHLGGIRHYKNASEMFGTQHYWNIADSLKQFENDPLLHEPGTAYAYTTFGYVLAGRVIEVIAGVPYLEYLKKEVFEPAKMNATQADDVYRIIPNRARGYQRLDTGEVLNAALLDTSGRIPGGGLSSTASDLVRFAIALDGGKLLRKNTVEAMAQPMTLRNGDSTKYGLGWGVYESEGKKRMIHTGGQSGVSTVLVYALSEHVALAMMFNLESVQLQALTDKILQLVLQR